MFKIVGSPSSPWGDYGTVLWYGVPVQVRGAWVNGRTGPFVPPIGVLRRRVYVTDSMLAKLRERGLPNVDVTDFVFGKLVRHDWHTWFDGAMLAHDRRLVPVPDIDARRNATPRGGEPAGYVWAGKHDPSLEREMPRCFRLVAPIVDGFAEAALESRRALVETHGLVRPFEEGATFVSSHVKALIEDCAAHWVGFDSVDS